ncbi:tyrosine-type recombinase/integrase [Microvirga massiliensis]|uniref:tyrosine-type recombinase/integrase n=1 Tax=Microvirga massiliensis TaxID=1033741 RepID=UPI0006603313|nr:tyrosine-type recombinase/integrase [Microvirga massiliensis]
MPKAQKSPIRYVYDQPNRHGRTRYYFWRGEKGQRKFRVKDDIVTGAAFYAAYSRFLDGQHPYPDQEAVEKARTDSVEERRKEAKSTSTKFPVNSWGWLCLEYMKTDTFRQQKNKRAIEGQLRWTWDQPLRRSNPDGRTYGDMPLDRFDTEAIQTLVDRKVTTTDIDENAKRTGKSQKVTKTTGGPQKNNLIKWVRGVLKFAIKRKLVKVNYAHFVEKEQVKGGGYKMWTDEMWDRMVHAYPLGTKQRLTFDLAGYTGQRRGDVYLLGWDQYIPPEDGLPYGSLRVEQEKGDVGDPYVAHIPILDELHESLEAAKANGILGSKFFVRQDHKDEPYVKESFGNMVRRWLDKAGIPNGFSLHGLRKLCVCRLIERGCDPHDVMAVTGHQTLKEIDRYAKAYFREKKKADVYKKWRAGMQEAETATATSRVA